MQNKDRFIMDGKKWKNEESKVFLTQGGDEKLKTVDPKKENADQFMKIDANGNALENFFKKFSLQLIFC